MTKGKLRLRLALILCLVTFMLAVGVIAASAEIEGYYTYTVTDGKATITDVDTSIAGDVTIPSTLGGYPVTAVGDEAFYRCRNLSSVTIPDGVISIGNKAFYRCTGLSDITIGNSVTSVGDAAFYSCYHLTSVTVPGSVKNIGEEAFADCSALVSVTIGNGVTNIGSDAFRYCDNITSVHITDLVAWCNIVFEDARSNPLFDAGKLYLDGNPLTELVIPDGVTSIGDYAFCGYDSLASVVISGDVTSVGNHSFMDCNNLTSVTIGDSVTSIGEDAFGECYKIVEVINKSNLTITEGAEENGFVAYYALEVHDGESKIVNTNDYLFYTYDDINYLLGYVGNDTELVLPEGYNGEKYQIYDGAFFDRDDVTSVAIGDGAII